MKYRVGQPVWVNFCAENYRPAGGWLAAVVVGYSRIFPDKYLVDVPACPFPYGADFAEGHWCPHESGMRPRDEPSEKTREETGDWELCPWRPESLTVSESV